MKNIKSNFYIVFSNFFRSSFPDGKFIPFQLHLFIKRLIFDTFSDWIGFVIVFLFFIQSEEAIYDPTRLGFIL